MSRLPPDIRTIPLTKAKARHLIERFYLGAGVRELAGEFGLTVAQVELVIRAYSVRKKADEC